MSQESSHKRIIAVVLVLIAVSTIAYAFVLNGSFVSYSAGVSSCPTLTDANSGLSKEYCNDSTNVFLGASILPVLSTTTLTPDGKNWTLYNSQTGASAPLKNYAKITLIANAGPVLAVTTSCTMTMAVDGKVVLTNSSSSTFISLPKLDKFCMISRDGKTLETQDFGAGTTHIISWTFSGKFTAIFPTGATQTRSFSGALGNMTVKVTSTAATHTSSVSVESSGLPLPTIEAPPSAQVGSSVNAVVVSTTVPAVTAPLTDPTAPASINPDYVKEVNQVIETTVGSSTTDVQVGTSTITVSVCQVGSCSYSPNVDGTATTTAFVTKSDVAIYERDAQGILRQFGAESINDLTPYSRCAYFRQGC